MKRPFDRYECACEDEDLETTLARVPALACWALVLLAAAGVLGLAWRASGRGWR